MFSILENIWKTAAPTDLMDTKLRVIFQQSTEDATKVHEQSLTEARPTELKAVSSANQSVAFCILIIYFLAV